MSPAAWRCAAARRAVPGERRGDLEGPESGSVTADHRGCREAHECGPGESGSQRSQLLPGELVDAQPSGSRDGRATAAGTADRRLPGSPGRARPEAGGSGSVAGLSVWPARRPADLRNPSAGWCVPRTRLASNGYRTCVLIRACGGATCRPGGRIRHSARPGAGGPRPGDRQLDALRLPGRADPSGFRPSDRALWDTRMHRSLVPATARSGQDAAIG